MLLRLTQNEKEILSSDSLLYVDGRLSINNIKEKVKERNNRYAKNFPNKLADGFYITGERLSKVSQIYKLP